MAEGGNQRPAWAGHQLYQDAIARFEREEWEEAASLLSQLTADYPGDPELEQILASVRLKASFDEGHVARGRSRLGRAGRRALLGLGISATLLLVAALAYTVYTRWLVPAWTVRDQLIHVREMHELARGYMAAGEYDRAATLYEEILDQAPNDDVAIAALRRAEQLQSLAAEYDRALSLTQEGRWWEALWAWRVIRAQDPNFRDTDYWLTFVERQDALGQLLREAEMAYAAGDWEWALAALERVRSQSADYRQEEVETLLAGALVSLAEQKLWEANDPLNLREEVLELFDKAVRTRPSDQSVLAEAQLAEEYLDSYERLQSGCEEQLQKLQVVYDPQAGSSLDDDFLILYQANVSCGDVRAAARDFQGARYCYVAATEMPVADVSAARDKYAALIPKLTPTATATPRPPTPIPTRRPPTATPTHTATVSPWRYSQLGAPIHRYNDKNDSGCEWLGVGGQVLDVAGVGTPGVIVRVWAGGWEGSTSLSGQEGEYGAGGWEVYLDDHPKDGVWSCQLTDPSGAGLSPIVTFQTYAGDCSRNLVLISFKQNY